MTSERIKDVLTFMCDACGEFEEAEYGSSFESMWAALKDKGWRATKLGSDWFHYCPECDPP
jgi:hypothetical protein